MSFRSLKASLVNWLIGRRACVDHEYVPGGESSLMISAVCYTEEKNQ